MTRTITTKVALVLLIPVCGALLALGVFYSFLAGTASDAEFFNIAGRQRLLAQQIHGHAHMVSMMGHDAERALLRDKVAAFDQGLQALTHGGEVIGHTVPPAPAAVAAELAKVNALWQQHKQSALLLVERPAADPAAREAYEFLKINTPVLRDSSDHVVGAFQERSQMLKQRMLHTLVVIASFDLLLLGAGIWLIRRYVAERTAVEQRLHADREQERMLVSELREAQGQLHHKMEALATANVRMVRIHDAIVRLRQADGYMRRQEGQEQFYQALLEDLAVLTGARYGAFGRFDRDGEMVDFITIGVSEEVRKHIGHLPSGKGVLGAFYREGHVTRVDDIAAHPDACGFPANHPRMTSLLGAPLEVGGVIRGVLYLADKEGGKPFTVDDEALLSLFVVEAAHAVERGELLAVLEQRNRALERDKAEQTALIEQLEQAQNQLLQAEKMASLGQLAAGVAHEINNPIGYINSNLTSLEKYTDELIRVMEVYQVMEPALEDHPELLQFVESVREDADLEYVKQDIRDLVQESQEGIGRVRKIVQDLKEFSHVDAAEWQSVDLRKGLDSTLNIVQNELKYKAEVVKEYGELPAVECIASQLNQVFMNLLVNAAHAIEERGVITVRTGTRAEEVWVEIADTGKGIARQHLNRLFEPFFTTKPVGKGTGLGLSLSYAIVQKHGGRIEVESEVGKGTTFRVWLPLRQGQAEPEVEAERKVV